jgi:hypothetical protein
LLTNNAFLKRLNNEDYDVDQCLQPYRNPTRYPGFFNKPKPNLTRNFETQTQPKPEFQNLTQPRKTGFILGYFTKKIYQVVKFSRKFHQKKNFIQTVFATWSTIEEFHG